MRRKCNDKVCQRLWGLFFSCFKCNVPNKDRILENHINKASVYALVKILIAIRVIITSINWQELNYFWSKLTILNWLPVEFVSAKSARWERYTLVAWKLSTTLWSERKGKKLLQIIFLHIFQYEVSRRKKNSLRNYLNQFFAHWYCWFFLCMISGSYTLRFLFLTI